MKFTKIIVLFISFIVLNSVLADINLYQSFENDDNIAIQDLNGNKLNINSEINISGSSDDGVLVSHDHTLKFKRNLFSNDIFNDNNQDNSIESIIVYLNNNNLNGEYSKIKSQKKGVASTTSSPLLSNYQITVEPVLTIVVNFKDGSDEIHMDQFSTIKTMTFNQTISICKILESFLDTSIQPCSSKVSPIFNNLLHMGLIPTVMNAPTFNDIPTTVDITPTSKRQRIIQSNKFAKASNDDSSYLELLNSKSVLNCLSIFNNNKLCTSTQSTMVVDYAISNKPSQFIGTTLKIDKHSIQFNEVALFKNEQLKLTIPTSASTSAPTSRLTLLNGDVQEIYQLNKLKANKVETITSATATTTTTNEILNENEEFSISSFENVIKKSGFHRELVTSLTVESSPILKVPRSCKLQILGNLDQGLFVDRYEVDEIERFGGPKVTIYQLIDLEKPSATSTQNYYSIISEFNLTESSQKLSVSLPIHLRYQNPMYSDVDAFRQSFISVPLIYIACESTNTAIEQLLNTDYKWNLISNFNLNNNNQTELKSLVLNVPVGQLNHVESVKLYTLLVTIIGSLLVIVTILFTHKKNTTLKKTK